jgi:hypothetical protein
MLLTLAGCSFALAPDTAEDTLGLLRELVDDSGCYELVVGDLDSAVSAIERVVCDEAGVQ